MSVVEIQNLLANDNLRYFFHKVTTRDGHCWYHSVCDLLITSEEILSYVKDEKLFDYIADLESFRDEDESI